jgi:hypothetical protein
MFSYSVSTGREIFNFVALGIFLLYFAGTSGVLSKDGISNKDHTGFATDEKEMFAFYNELITWDVWEKNSGRVFLFMILVLFGLIPSLKYENDMAIITNLSSFMVLIFVTIFVYFKYDSQSANIPE